MFGFLKKAVSGLVEGVKKTLERPNEQEKEEAKLFEEKPGVEEKIEAEVILEKPETIPEVREVPEEPIPEEPKEELEEQLEGLGEEIKELEKEEKEREEPVIVHEEQEEFFGREEHTELPTAVEVPEVIEPEPAIELPSPVEEFTKPRKEETIPIDVSGVVQRLPKPRKGLFDGLVEKVRAVTEKITRVVTEKEIKESEIANLLQQFNIQLIQANIESNVADRITVDLRNNLVGKRVKRAEDIQEIVNNSLRESLIEILDIPRPDLVHEVKRKKPYLIVFLGFNGAGKTTSIARVAHLLKKNGLSVVLAAGDSFRAAAIEQLEIHGKNLEIKVIKQQYGADSAAVVFDAVDFARAHEFDVVLADTAGRQHTNEGLMKELEKVVRVNKPDMKILVLDALSGSDIVQQAKEFDRIVGVDAIILTKTDVDEKGGASISAAATIQKPIIYIGTGQEYENFEPFDPERFVARMLA